MSTIVTTFELSSHKNCFLSRKHERGKNDRINNSQIVVYEANYGRDGHAFFSISGDVGDIKSGDCILINGMYASKLGIKDKQEVLLKPVSSSLQYASHVDVEPLTVDDWEILERNASRIETTLLDRIRVVWPKQVLPVWVERTMCVFIKVASVDPSCEFAVLDANTQVIVMPKWHSEERLMTAKPVPNLKMPPRQNAQDLTGNTPTISGNSPTPESPVKVRKTNRRFSQKSAKRVSRSDPIPKTDEDKDIFMGRNSSDTYPYLLYHMLSSIFHSDRNKPLLEPRKDKFDLDRYVQPDVPEDNLVYRLQASDPAQIYAALQSEVLSSSLENHIDYSQAALRELLQPSTIYVTVKDASGHPLGGRRHGRGCTAIYYAELRKLPSVAEREKALAESRKVGDKDFDPRKKSKDDGIPFYCIVRVVTVERKSAITEAAWRHAGFAVLRKNGITSGHAVVHSALRRQMKLDATGCVWIKTGRISFAVPVTLIMYPISLVPTSAENKALASAFRMWVEHVADEDHPLVVFNGMMVSFPLHSHTIEVQVMLGSGERTSSLLSQQNINEVDIVVQREIKDDKAMPSMLTPMLAYRRVEDFDPKLPDEHLDNLGGVRTLAEPLLRHIEVCLGSRPLPFNLFQNRPGFNHGLLLVTGPKGSGKTSLARALLHAVARPPTLAHIFYLDCKPLRGKRPDNLQLLLEKALDEAAFRQPSVILLDDLDVIAPAPNGPAFELSGEALLAAKVSEILQSLVRFEVRNFSRMALIVTSHSRSSLHPSLVASRGVHFVQEVGTIKPPDKTGRRELLRSILEAHSTIEAERTLAELDVEYIASRTEGFVAQDLFTLVNRALHSHLSENFLDKVDTVKLNTEDFDSALSGLKPLAIRNVSLHTAGDLGWHDVGGLEDVKAALIETLQWPSKYPQLFASCPLRLRSGLLLYGPPGTGKTLLAGAVAKECNLNFISIKGPELLSKYIGASEQSVRDLFNRAQSAKPCILFFDEFDSIAPKRGHDSTGVTDRVVNQFLTQLDGVEGLQGVYVLAATSRPDLVDPALLRPGRLDKCLYCGIPTKEERRAILSVLSQRMCLGDDMDLAEVADECEFFTGADFKALLYNAQLQAIHEYSNAEKALGPGILHFKNSTESCALLKRSTITINANRLSTSSSSPSPAAPVSFIWDEDALEEMEKANKSKSLPGPHGDAPAIPEAAVICAEPPVPPRSDLPHHLPLEGNWELVDNHKRKTVTFFPKMGDAPAVLSPQDEAHYLSMVAAVHRKQNQFLSTSNLKRRRGSSILLKPSVLIPVSQKHLRSAASSMRPSVSQSERLRYQTIYESFVSGRQGDFATEDVTFGKRATLA